MKGTFRKAGEGDRARIQEWIERNGDHAGIDAGFFLDAPLTETLAFEDEQGTVAYVRLSRALRVDIEYTPGSGRAEASRVARAMTAGFALLEKQARAAGFRELIFDSVAPRLIAFCARRLGFARVNGAFRRALG